jgi:hypothetical protein
MTIQDFLKTLLLFLAKAIGPVAFLVWYYVSPFSILFIFLILIYVINVLVTFGVFLTADYRLKVLFAAAFYGEAAWWAFLFASGVAIFADVLQYHLSPSQYWGYWVALAFWSLSLFVFLFILVRYIERAIALKKEVKKASEIRK